MNADVAPSQSARDFELVFDFNRDRAQAIVAAKYALGDPFMPPQTCRYCGKHWRKWSGSQLDGHAACVVTVDFKLRLLAAMKADATLSFDRVSKLLGVTYSVVRAWTFPRRSS